MFFFIIGAIQIRDDDDDDANFSSDFRIPACCTVGLRGQ